MITYDLIQINWNASSNVATILTRAVHNGKTIHGFTDINYDLNPYLTKDFSLIAELESVKQVIQMDLQSAIDKLNFIDL